MLFGGSKLVQPKAGHQAYADRDRPADSAEPGAAAGAGFASGDVWLFDLTGTRVTSTTVRAVFFAF